MELVFDVVSAPPAAGGAASMSFKQAGGIIGRAADCDWVLADPKRVLSSRHAQVSYRDGGFHLTDTSSNGIRLKDSGAALSLGQPQRIEHGNVFCLGDYEIRARLIQDPAQHEQAYPPQNADSLIPDDAFLDLDPLHALDQQERVYTESDALEALLRPAQSQAVQHDYAPLVEEYLQVPELVMPAAAPLKPAPVAAPERHAPAFWERFGEALGVPLDDLDDAAREALAVEAARLLQQTIGGLQQSLRTRSELKNELRLALTTVQSAGNNPLKHSADPAEAMRALLRGEKPGQLPASQSISRGFRDLQAHQVALLAASRAAVKGMFEQLSPEQLVLRFERDGRKPLFATAGSRWRAYRRLHGALQQQDDWTDRLFAKDFATTYEAQVRLISTLNTDLQG